MRGLILAALLLAGAATQAADTAPRRMLAAHEQAGWAGVGRLEMGDGYCTATLFSETLALTAAHCLFGPDGRPRPTAALWFRPGDRDGRAQAVRQVRRAAVHPDYRHSGRFATFESISADLALIELDAPLPTWEIPSYAPGAMPVPGGAVALPSYGRGRDRALSLQEPCRVLERSGPVARLDCEVAPGSSGSPVLAREDGGLRLVGVISAMGARGAYAAVAEDALPPLQAALAAAAAPPAPVRAGGGLSGRPGGWKSVRPPSD